MPMRTVGWMMSHLLLPPTDVYERGEKNVFSSIDKYFAKKVLTYANKNCMPMKISDVFDSQCKSDQKALSLVQWIQIKSRLLV